MITEFLCFEPEICILGVAPSSGRNLHGHFLVNFCRFFPHSLEDLVIFHQISVNFSQFWSVLSRPYRTKTQELLTDIKVVRNNTQELIRIKRESVSVMGDFVRRLPQIWLCGQRFFGQRDSVSVIGNNFPQKMSVCNQFGYDGKSKAPNKNLKSPSC